MQRIDTDRGRPFPRGRLGEQGQGGEIADALIVVTPQRVKLRRDAESFGTAPDLIGQKTASRRDREMADRIRSIIAPDAMPCLPAEAGKSTRQTCAGSPSRPVASSMRPSSAPSRIRLRLTVLPFDGQPDRPTPQPRLQH